MMKFIMYMFFMLMMLMWNNLLSFYYNLLYLLSMMLLTMMLYKDDIWTLISVNYGVSAYSLMLVILSIWILGLMFMSLGEFDYKKSILFLILGVVLFMFFIFLDLMMFYMTFEISMLPMFFMIIYWGDNQERLSASYYLMMYMLFISFPFLMYIFSIYNWGMSMKFSVLNLYMNTYKLSFWGFFMVFMAFFIKLPIYMMHLWLPKAHVEAPVYGSMILAGVLLKMGGYGIIRFLLILYVEVKKFSYIIFIISIMGGMIMSILSMVQVDMKMLVAYSSVVHMNLMLSSMMIMSKLGILSSYMIMISHGLCSSGLFYMVNLYYQRSLSRLLVLNKGMMSILPILSLWWFLFCVMNFSYPFSLNFIGEVLMLMNILSWDKLFMLYVMLIIFFSGAYSLYLYSYIQYGMFFFSVSSMNNSLMVEYMILIIHFFPLLMMLLNLDMMM